jgi:hypothetical protein
MVHQNQIACSWYCINWFNLVKLSVSLGYTVCIWELFKVDGKVCYKWLTGECVMWSLLWAEVVAAKKKYIP